MDKEIIIYQPWGGLGDNLQFSTLPEMFYSLGYKVYISTENSHRNPEIYDLVWGKNPFVSGKKQGTPNAGSCVQDLWPPDSQNEWFIHRIEIAHGFDRTNYYPKIYYIPQIINQINDTFLVDITGYSQIYSVEKYYEFFDKIQNIIHENRNKIKIVTFNYRELDQFYVDIYKKYFGNYDTLVIKDIYEYADVLKSCNTFITICSGAHSLAAAVKGDCKVPKIICYFPHGQYSSCERKGCYNYKNVDYIVSDTFH